MDRAMDTGAAPRPPNLIVIFCGDLGYGDLGIDERTGIAGADRRPVGRVDDPVTLLPRPEEHLWVRAYHD